MAPGNPQATPGAGRRPGEVDADAKSLSRVSPPGHFSAGTPRSIPVAPAHRPAAARPKARPGHRDGARVAGGTGGQRFSRRASWNGRNERARRSLLQKARFSRTRARERYALPGKKTAVKRHPKMAGRGVLTAPRPGGLRTPAPTWRHMGSLHSLLRMHWDHEPDWHP